MGVELLGPAPKPIARIQGAERWHILVRCGSRSAIQSFLKGALPLIRGKRPSGIRVAVDVDPRHVL
jgi:primosomal protein N'